MNKFNKKEIRGNQQIKTTNLLQNRYRITSKAQPCMTTNVTFIDFGKYVQDFEACLRYLQNLRNRPVETGPMAKNVKLPISQYIRGPPGLSIII